MFLLIVSLVVVLPLIELYIIVQVGQQVGLLPTVALLIAISAVGTSLVKREGMRVYKDFTAAIQRGEEPSTQIVHGVCVLAAGVFLFAPGFISDALAITSSVVACGSKNSMFAFVGGINIKSFSCARFMAS